MLSSCELCVTFFPRCVTFFSLLLWTVCQGCVECFHICCLDCFNMACWAHSALMEFIELYRSEECLWKIKSPSYSNRNLKEQAYQRLLQFVHTFEPTARKHNINCQQIVGIHLSTVAVVFLCRIYSRNVDTHLARTIPWICAMMWIHI